MDVVRVKRCIFSGVHTINGNLTRRAHKIGLISMDGTNGSVIVTKLDAIIQQYNIGSKTMACVYNGGSNLRTYHTHLIVKVSYDQLGYSSHVSGSCMAHVRSNAIYKCLVADCIGTAGAPFFSGSQVRNK